MYGVSSSAGGTTDSQSSSPMTHLSSLREADRHIDETEPNAQHLSTQTNRLDSIPGSPEFLPGLPPPYRSLFDYFTRVADSFSCDERVKHDFYATFIPIAVDTSHVMAAVLSLAAVHRVSSGLQQSPKLLAHLQVVAVEQLRSKLVADSLNAPSAESVLCTIMLLCYSEIVAGGDKSRSWRLHLEGAASVFGRDLPSWSISSQRNPSRAFICRCFVSLVALANVSAHPPSDVVSQQAMQMAMADDRLLHIDEFTAYSTDLVQVLIEIGFLLRKRDQIPALEEEEFTCLDEHASRLAQKVQAMLRRSRVSLGPTVKDCLSPSRRNEYLTVDEAYHQAALLHIHQRLRGLPSSSREIQTIVYRILALVEKVQLLDGPCPGIVLLFPLFSAGCGAIDPKDRQRVRVLLTDMIDRFGLRTVQQSMTLLENLWSHWDQYGEEVKGVTWERFIGKSYEDDAS